MARLAPSRFLRRLGFAVCFLAIVLIGNRAFAQNSFSARTDRVETTLGESVIYEVTLSLTGGRAQGYRPPGFNGFRVVGEQPSQSTQIQMGGNRTVTRTVYSWRYELSPTRSGKIIIDPARVQVGGKELKTYSIALNVASGALQPQRAANADPVGRAPAPPRRLAPPRQRRSTRFPFDQLFGGGEPPTDNEQATAIPAQQGGSFVRAVPDKTSVYVGEAIIVEWLLYLTEHADKYQAITEPHTDGFWTEDLAVPNNQGSLALTQQTYRGRNYLVAPLLKKALFPLQAGSLVVTPLESEISQVDFFGRQVRNQRLKADPLKIDVMPLPTAGRPASFDPGNVGRFAVEARVDRGKVAVGEAVTITVAVTGEGNLRKLTAPQLPPLAGWKTYAPKSDVKMDNTSGIRGTKTLEYLLLPERPGTTVVPPLQLAFFDPTARHYQIEKTAPLSIVVAGEAAPGRGTTNPAKLAPPASAENVLPLDIRPLRGQATLRRDFGTTLYQSRGFLAALLFPPFAFGLTLIGGRLRSRFNQDTQHGRRRQTRRLIRHHLQAAERQLEAGRSGPFYSEIDRVLREVLTARLARPVTGLSRDELKPLLANSGLSHDLAVRALASLEECDRARFSSGMTRPDEMRALLDRSADLILQIEKTPVAGGLA